jgi:hypothetical protein
MELAELTDCRVQVEEPQNRAFARGLALTKYELSKCYENKQHVAKPACPYLIYFTRYVSAMFHSTLMLREKRLVLRVSYFIHFACIEDEPWREL